MESEKRWRTVHELLPVLFALVQACDMRATKYRGRGRRARVGY